MPSLFSTSHPAPAQINSRLGRMSVCRRNLETGDRQVSSAVFKLPWHALSWQKGREAWAAVASATEWVEHLRES